MDREEMLARLEKGEDPLELSIQKWQDIVDGKGEDLLDSNCALCQTTPIHVDDSCDGCLIKAKTGKDHCKGTPYHDFGGYSKQKHAKLELEFLKSLRPKETKL